MNVRTAPIGIFDSGLGGLSVAREVRSLLPNEDVLYVADSAYCPYGEKTADFVQSRTLLIAERLVERGVKLLVVACNTACGVALETLRAALAIPVVGLEPAVRPAVQLTRSGRIGVLATSRTVESERLSGLITRFAHDSVVYTVAAPALVDLVERGETNGAEADLAVWALIQPMLARNVDAIVLGCTHFPFLRATVERIAGPDVMVIDSGPAIARRVDEVLGQTELHNRDATKGRFWIGTTGDPEAVSLVASRLLEERVDVEYLPVAAPAILAI